jgi:hypothetical protein
LDALLVGVSANFQFLILVILLGGGDSDVGVYFWHVDLGMKQVEGENLKYASFFT